MMSKKDLSNCCKAPTKLVGGIGDFSDREEGITCHWQCTGCGKPCDIEALSLDEKIDNILIDITEAAVDDVIQDRRTAEEFDDQELPKYTAQILKLIDDYIEPHIRYCEEANGLSFCKNCQLTRRTEK